MLAKPARIRRIIIDELTEVRKKYAVPRRTEIADWSGDMEDEDLIEREDMVVTITYGGYVKRTRSDQYRLQNRGGLGIKVAKLSEDRGDLAGALIAHPPRGDVRVLFFGFRRSPFS